ncbi:MAG: hypothetical protein OHK0032_11830 [Thermodesulfovibrionales bacterium]
MGWAKKIDYRANGEVGFAEILPLHLLGIKNVLKKGVQYKRSGRDQDKEKITMKLRELGYF